MKPKARVTKTIAAGVFKARCLRVMEDVRKSRESVLITKRGKPIARLGPVEEESGPDVFGSMRGKIEIRGDIVAPVVPAEGWNAVR